MERVFIDSERNNWYAAFAGVYAESFPIFEQRTAEQQRAAFADAAYRLAAYIEKGGFVGFVAYWEFDTYIYIEHFAVAPALRGQGAGGRILDEFTASGDKTVILEIDPIVDDVSASRLRFYMAHGFVENAFPHIHPPYRKGRSGHHLVVMSHGRTLSPSEYETFADNLAHRVMAF